MKPSTDLFDLVRSMSPSEKRFFRLGVRFRKNGRPPQYLRLFDHLCSPHTITYDESVAKAHFEGAACLRQFTRIKNYLYNRLLQSLRQYHAENSVRRRCLSHLDAADLLANRQLYSQAQRQVAAAKGLAHQYALTDLQLVALTWERRLLKATGKPGLALRQLEEQEAKSAEKQRQERELHALYDRFWMLNKQRRDLAKVDADAVEALRKAPILEESSEPLSFVAALARTLCLAIYHRLRGEKFASHQHYKTAIKIWEKEPGMTKAFPDRYLRAVAAFLYSCHAVGDYSEFPPLLSRIRDDSTLSGVDRARILAIGYNLQILYLLNQAPLSQGMPTAKALAAELETGIVPLSEWIPAATNLAIFAFLQEDFPTARHWLGQILNLPRGPEWTDLRELARLLWLPLLYETEKFGLLGYALRSMLRYVQHRRPLNPLELQARHFFSAVDKNPDFMARMEALRIWRTAMEESSLDGFLGSEILKIWVEARLRNVSLEMVRQETMIGNAKEEIGDNE